MSLWRGVSARLRRGCPHLFLPAFLLLAWMVPPVRGELVSSLWTRTNNLYGYGHDAWTGVALDSQGSVIAVGYYRNSLVTSPTIDNSAIVVKFPAPGATGWTNIVETGPAAGNKVETGDTFSDVAVDAEDNVIVVGTKSGSWAYDGVGQYHSIAVVRKYQPGGTLLWERTHQQASGAWNTGTGVSVDAAGNIYVSATVFTDWGTVRHQWALLKYDKNGTLQSGFPVLYNYSTSETYPDAVFDIAADNAGNFVGVGVRGASVNDRQWHVRKYATNRALVWEATYSRPLLEYANAVALDSQGNVLVIGQSNRGTDNSAGAVYDWVVTKYKAALDAGGQQALWTQTLSLGTNQHTVPNDLVVDAQDNVWVAGYESDTNKVAHWRLELRRGSDGALLDSQTWPATKPQVLYQLAARNRRVALCGYETVGTNNWMRLELARLPLPVISLQGPNPLTLEVGTAYTEPGFSVADLLETNLLSRVNVSGTVNPSVLGTNLLRYNVSATNGDAALEQVREVRVVDTTAPTLVLTGAAAMDLDVGTPYVEAGWAAQDTYEGDLSNRVVVTGTVNPAALGTYVLRYSVADSSANAAPERTRTIRVVDRVPPTLLLSGPASLVLEVDMPFLDPGCSASDNYEGNISARIVVTGSVDIRTPGTYLLRYNVADLSGNPAAEVARTVTVTNSTPVLITGLSLPGQGMVRISWTSRSNDNFTVWSTFQLGTNAWREESSVPSKGASTSWVDPNADVPIKYYRVQRR